jgi:outer membrane protein assembly factor BamB
MFFRAWALVLGLVSAGLQGDAVCRAQTGEGQFREFRDQQGRAIQARVLEVSGQSVTLQRNDGRQFTVSISLFSQADQDYIRGRSRTPAGRSESERGDAWPRFRGPNGMGVSEAKGVPLEWDANTNIAWKTPLPGPGASSPITFGDTVYLTCYSGYLPGKSGSLEQLERHLIALRRDTGQIVWDRSIPAALPEEQSIRDHGYAANTPAADAHRVYTFMGKSGVFAFDHQGKQIWQADIGSGFSGWGTAASPLLYKDMVLINASVESQSLVALDRETGREKWRAPGIREAWNTPIIVRASSGREELIVARHGDVLAFEPESGQPLWSCKTDITWYMVPTAVASEGVIYFLGGRSGTAALAVRAGGSGDVTATHRLWTSKTGSNVTSPIYLDGHVYWMSEKLGVAYCAKAESGQLIYEKRLERAGQVYASPVMAEGRLYYLTRDGKMFVLAAKPEFQQLAVNDLNDGSRFDGSPAVAGNRLLIRSEKFLYCIGR